MLCRTKPLPDLSGQALFTKYPEATASPTGFTPGIMYIEEKLLVKALPKPCVAKTFLIRFPCCY